jgi:hypothetical protein
MVAKDVEMKLRFEWVDVKLWFNPIGKSFDTRWLTTAEVMEQLENYLDPRRKSKSSSGSNTEEA